MSVPPASFHSCIENLALRFPFAPPAADHPFLLPWLPALSSSKQQHFHVEFD
jgi:hypothetical protein